MSTGSFYARHLAVVGLGLMGGSIAMALRERADTITGVDVRSEACQFALDNKIVDSVTEDLYSGVKDADVVILCAPVRTIQQLLQKRIGSYLRSNTLLMDIGSTKQSICEAMGQLPIGINAVGGHPMTGKEINGISASDPNLYRNRPFVLCRTRRTTPAALVRALSLVQALGAIAIEMDAERHDRVVAAISHLPYILSAALVATVANEGKNDDAVWKLAAGGFRDTSRLAASDISMMSDILSTNTKSVATLLAMFRVQMALLETMLISGDEQQLTDSLKQIREARIEWAGRYEQKRNPQ